MNAAPIPTYGATTSVSTTRTNTPLKHSPASIQVVPGVTRIDQTPRAICSITPSTAARTRYRASTRPGPSCPEIFFTGSLKHSLLAGVDYGYLEVSSGGSNVSSMTLDLFNPNYLSGLTPADPLPRHQASGADAADKGAGRITGGPIHRPCQRERRRSGTRPADGILAARRHGVATDRRHFTVRRLGRSYSPNVGHSGSEVTYAAEIAEQFEVGVKQELVTDRLSANLALFNLNRNHILTTDPTNPLLEVLTGKQRSQGVELDIAGNITPQPTRGSRP